MTQVRHTPLAAAAACAALAVTGCASGSGSAFSAASQHTQQAQQAADAENHTPTDDAPGQPARGSGGSSNSGGGSVSSGSAGSSGSGGGALGGSANGGGRVIYVSGNVLLPVHGANASKGAGATLGLDAGGKASAMVKADGVKLALNADPLGAAGDVTKGVAGDLGDPLMGIGKGKPVLGRKGGGGALGGVGKTAGSLIGSGSQDTGSGGNLLTGLLAGGRHKKAGG